MQNNIESESKWKKTETYRIENFVEVIKEIKKLQL